MRSSGRLTIQTFLACLGAVLISCAGPDADRERLKEELKREILSELGESPAASNDPAEEHPSPGGVSFSLPTGRVEGRVLFRKRGLSACRVRLVLLESSAVAFGPLLRHLEGKTLETTTGPDGTFALEDVPVGAYRVKWSPPGESGWIRRLSDRPDLHVEQDKTATIADFHAGRPVADGT